ncbi:MAG: tRNA sulfurtransferase [Halobacteriaceae archaeon]
MHPPGADAVVVRFGEIYTKSDAVRERMTARLRDNLDAILADRNVEGTVEAYSGRLVVRTPAPDAAAAAAADAPGVVSASPAASVPSERAAIADAVADAAREHYDGGSFAVDANRGDSSLPFDSEDVGEFGGAAVFDAVGNGPTSSQAGPDDAVDFEPTVDLDDPDFTVGVDCRTAETFVFVERRDGPGGLPVGSQDPLVALLSGGIDSPVAAFEAMRRGSPVVPVYLDIGDYGGPDHRARAVESMRTLREYAPHADTPAYVVPAGESVARIAEELDQGRMLAFRRYMFRVAEEIADREGCSGVVTGEVVGQKSSQTAANLAVTSAATTLPIHRPLLTEDKTDVMEQARAIGTFADATIPAGCNRFAPDRPATGASLSTIEAQEPDDLFAWAAADAAAAERL